jgi:hypothetical protein
MRTHLFLFLSTLPLLLAAGGCQQTGAGSALPQDPVELAQALGDFRLEATWPWGTGDPEKDAGFTWIYSPKDLGAMNAGRLVLGYPHIPPGPKCQETDCPYGGGVGEAWVRPLPQVRPYFTAAPDLWDFVHSLPEGDFHLEQYLRIFGRWYRIEARAHVFLRDGGRRFGVEIFPAEAYPLEKLPEIDLYPRIPPVLVAGVCAQPGGLNPQDPWAAHFNAPYYLFSTTNAVQYIYYENGRRVSASFSEPPSFYEYCPMCPHLSGIDPDYDTTYDIFVRFVNTERRQAHAYGLWWRVYNPLPLRVERRADGTYACHNFSRANLNTWEGPFTLEEFRAKYFDPANPPERYTGPR